MGRSVKVTYVIKEHVRHPDGTVRVTTRAVSDGRRFRGDKVSALEKDVRAMVESYKVGGVNDHIPSMYGFVPVPFKAELVNQKTGQVYVWCAPTFMVI